MILCLAGDVYYWSRKRDEADVDKEYIFARVEFEKKIPSRIQPMTLESVNQLYDEFKNNQIMINHLNEKFQNTCNQDSSV